VSTSVDDYFAFLSDYFRYARNVVRLSTPNSVSIKMSEDKSDSSAAVGVDAACNKARRAAQAEMKENKIKRGRQEEGERNRSIIKRAGATVHH